jgi:hypothetical protein
LGAHCCVAADIFFRDRPGFLAHAAWDGTSSFAAHLNFKSKIVSVLVRVLGHRLPLNSFLHSCVSLTYSGPRGRKRATGASGTAEQNGAGTRRTAAGASSPRPTRDHSGPTD